MKKRLKNLNKFVAKLTGENYLWRSLFWSSLIYNMSARQERHECDTSATQATRVWHERRDSDTSETIARHYWDTSDTSAARVQECDTNDTSVTGVKNFDFKMARRETFFHTPILAMWQMKRYKERKTFILRITYWKCVIVIAKCVWKMHHNN